MRVSDAFPSNYLKAADLHDKNVTVVIERVDMEEIGSDHKPVVYFKGKEKGLVLNKTNANNISVAYGDDTDDWPGGEIVLFPAMVDFQGRTVPAIRVRIPPRRPARAVAPAPAPVQQHDERNPPPRDMDDEIPF